MHLGDKPTDAEIVAFVERWIDDLARGDFAAAYARTAHDPYYQWTPELIQTVIAGYGHTAPHPNGTIFRVTSRATASGQPHYHTVDRKAVCPPAFAAVLHDLPLNGKWSDLTATFRIEPSERGSRVVLEEIHVF